MSKDGLRGICKICCSLARKERLRKIKELTPIKIPPDTKICPNCGVEKHVTEFRKRADRPRGVGYHCKECACNKSKNYYQLNTDDRRECAWEYRKLNGDKVREAFRRWRLENPKYIKEWQKKSYDTNPNFHIRCILRSRLRGAINRAGGEKDISAIELLGCPVWHLLAHFDFLFKPGMTRDNHGSVWEIDHIRPCASFDLTQPEEQKACFHWTNLQPLFIEENRRKGCSYG